MNAKETKRKTNRPTSTSESSSLSIIRSFLRYAASTIVYHKLSNKNKEQSTNEPKNVMEINDNHELRRQKNNECMSEDQLERCFVKKTFCGLNDLKFIDAVDEHDLVKDENSKSSLYKSLLRRST